MFFMVSAKGFMVLYVGLELQSLSLYILTSIRRDSIKSTEAGLKYFVLGALSSGILLYGISLIYGYAGTTRFVDVFSILSSGEMSLGLLLGLVFVLAALEFKKSAVHFQMLKPDVYGASPTPVTAFLVTAPKVAGMVLVTRVLYDCFLSITDQWQQIVVFLSVASMIVGSIAAINQTNLKRLMAYSSIGHVGFALVGLSAGTALGAQSVLIYMTIYVVTNLGVFSFLLSMKRGGRHVSTIQDLAGLSKSNPSIALAVSILMLSLAGIPPMIGFFAKYFSFMAAVDAGLVWLAIAGVVASVIATFYYLRVVKIIFVDESASDITLDSEISTSQKIVLVVCTLITVISWLPIFDGFKIVELSREVATALLL
jgi:NADH-quinone oxidoreductase subunit N